METFGYSKKVNNYLSSLIKYLDEKTVNDMKKDYQNALEKSPDMSLAETETLLNNIMNKYNITLYNEIGEKSNVVYHLKGFPQLKKAFGVSGTIFKIATTSINDVISFINIEEKLETVERYKTFLEKIVNGKKYLPKDIVIAANQLLQNIVLPYKNEIESYISDIIDNSNKVFHFNDRIKDTVSTSVKKKYPLLFSGKIAKFNGSIGGALGVIEFSAPIVDAIAKVGTGVKQSTYVEAYAYLGRYFSLLLDESKNKFNSNAYIDNAWDFYDMYHLLFRVRACGENAYLKMCKESAITKILAKVGFKWFDITDREQYVKDTFDYMNNYCFFGLDNVDEIPETHKFAQKAVIKCLVNVEIYDKSNKLITKISDGNQTDVTNAFGRFICQYDSKKGEYIKVIYLNDSKDYIFKIIGRDSGNVSIETAKMLSDTVVTAKITGLPIEENGVITIHTDTYKYEDNRYGDNSDVIVGEMQKTVGDSIVLVQSLSLTENSIVMQQGEKRALGVVVKPINATCTNVLWNSSNEMIATVNAGAIKAVAPGKAIITAETYDGKLKATCTVIVKSESIFGDVNGDESVDIADALMVARYDAGLIQLDETQLSVSDVNKDDSVDIADALMIARYDAGLINSLV